MRSRFETTHHNITWRAGADAAPRRLQLTVFRAHSIFLAVAQREENLFDAELRQLEARMEEIVRVCDQLKEENRSLKERQDALITERASLLQKNELVRGRVEAMIGRLKSMEHGG